MKAPSPVLPLRIKREQHPLLLVIAYRGASEKKQKCNARSGI
ncbi:hypothetical protein HMPREF9296_1093 [Prevotella disiens FB035-09AN]|uniref:Uncharacterized protein n=1 Tax=Prevotella disiens FB035-09AN TaxID=866771 RepID=E1KTW4_9BACT|nr:hypothetical protein HMPREF9296_1093 [Prevotella disiens FB035-09AN]